MLRSAIKVVVMISTIGYFDGEVSIPKLVKVMDQRGRSIVGEIIEQGPENLRVKNLATNEEQDFRKSDIRRLIVSPTDQEIISTIKPATLIGWRLLHALPKPVNSGKVASVEGNLIFLNLGVSSGIRVGDELHVSRVDKELKDPDTGEILGRQRRRISQIQITEVAEKFSKAKVSNDSESPINQNDEVDPVIKDRFVAVFPLISTNGAVYAGAQEIAEELTTRLTRGGASVVERSILAKALAELTIQRSSLFDVNATRRLGKQIGAAIVVSGRIVPSGKSGASITVRAVEVETGKIIDASSVTVSKFNFLEVDDPFIEPSAEISKNNEEGAEKLYHLKNLKPKGESSGIVKGGWTVEDSLLATTSPRSVFGLPIEARGSYQMDLQILVPVNSDTVFIALPAGRRQVYLELSSRHGRVNSLSFVEGRHSDSNGTASNSSLMKNGQWNDVKVKVGIQGELAEILCEINDKQALKWKGEWRDLGADNNWTPPKQNQIGVAAVNVGVQFREIKVSGAVTGRSHVKSGSQEDFGEVVVVPAGGEAFVFEAALGGALLFQQA